MYTYRFLAHLQGINFKDIADPTNQIQFAALAEQTFGDRLMGLALGNEPDLYERPGHNSRPSPYGYTEYMAEWGQMATSLATNPGYSNKQMLMGPSTCCVSSDYEWDNSALCSLSLSLRFISFKY